MRCSPGTEFRALRYRFGLSSQNWWRVQSPPRQGGKQKDTVEHVDVHAGGQAVVGIVESPRGGDQPKSEDQARAKQIAHAPQPAVWSADKERQPLPVSGDAERPLPDARRDVPGRPEG